MRYWFLAFVITGCHQDWKVSTEVMDAPEGSYLATQIAFDALGAAPDDSLPQVFFTRGEPSPGFNGQTNGHIVYVRLDRCPNRPQSICKVSETSLAHELLHVILIRQDVLRGDADHTDPRWNELLPAVNKALSEQGM